MADPITIENNATLNFGGDFAEVSAKDAIAALTAAKANVVPDTYTIPKEVVENNFPGESFEAKQKLAMEDPILGAMLQSARNAKMNQNQFDTMISDYAKKTAEMESNAFAEVEKTTKAVFGDNLEEWQNKAAKLWNIEDPKAVDFYSMSEAMQKATKAMIEKGSGNPPPNNPNDPPKSFADGWKLTLQDKDGNDKIFGIDPSNRASIDAFGKATIETAHGPVKITELPGYGAQAKRMYQSAFEEAVRLRNNGVAA